MALSRHEWNVYGGLFYFARASDLDSFMQHWDQYDIKGTGSFAFIQKLTGDLAASGLTAFVMFVMSNPCGYPKKHLVQLAYKSSVNAAQLNTVRAIYAKFPYVQDVCYMTAIEKQKYIDASAKNKQVHLYMEYERWIKCGCIDQRFLEIIEQQALGEIPTFLIYTYTHCSENKRVQQQYEATVKSYIKMEHGGLAMAMDPPLYKP